MVLAVKRDEDGNLDHQAVALPATCFNWEPGEVDAWGLYETITGGAQAF